MKPKFRIRSRKAFKSRISFRKQGAGCILSTAAAIFLSGASDSLAATFVINIPTFLTNGGNVVDGNDTITVTGTGSISPPATNDGIFATGVNNTITNDGTIATTGNYAQGIETYNGNIITNSGSITTAGNYAQGIYGYDGNTISNSGTISTSGNYAAAGIHAIDGNNIINSGTIVTNGNYAYGIEVDDGNTITNIGTITTYGDYAEGIDANDYNTITNSGSIITYGDYSEGLDIDDGNMITNSGTIITLGEYSEGIDADDGNTITNIGTITTYGDNAEGIDANDYNTIVNSGSIITFGYDSYGINVEDFNSVTNSGSITTYDEDSHGIYVDEFNTVTNSGSITTYDDDSYGIYAGDFNTIINSGSITTSGEDAVGIYADDFNTIINSGSITTSGDDAYGIEAINTNNITNSGSINTSGDVAHGIYVEDFNTITNTGSITTSGDFAYGIYAEDSNTITNSGTIATTGDSAYGIDADDGNTITNSGTITTTGEDAYGIEAGDDNTITHSGRIFSAQAAAFDLENNNTLNLISPAFIAGAIDVGTNATVNITTGPSHSILWDLDGTFAGGAPNFAGSVPVFYNAATQQVATFDPTGLAAQSDELADLGGSISGIIASRTANGVSPGSRWWAAGFAGTTSYDGNAGTLDRDSNNAGIAFGYDTQMSPSLMLGLLAGWNSSELDDAQSRFANSFDRESDGFFAAAYGRAEKGSGFLDFALMGGFLGHDDRRFINDNLAVGGADSAQSSYDSWWIAPQAGVGYAFEMPYDWTLTPYASVRWSYQSFDGYSEAGSFANATVADRDISVLEARAQISGDKQIGIAAVSLRTGVQFRSAGDDNARVTMIGQTRSISDFADDRTSVFLGGSVGVEISETSMLSVDAEGLTGDGMTSFRGILKYSLSF
jgi:hypothetical protein